MALDEAINGFQKGMLDAAGNMGFAIAHFTINVIVAAISSVIPYPSGQSTINCIFTIQGILNFVFMIILTIGIIRSKDPSKMADFILYLMGYSSLSILVAASLSDTLSFLKDSLYLSVIETGIAVIIGIIIHSIMEKLTYS